MLIESSSGSLPRLRYDSVACASASAPVAAMIALGAVSTSSGSTIATVAARLRDAHTTLKCSAGIGDHDHERDLGAGAAGRRDADHGRARGAARGRARGSPTRCRRSRSARRRPWPRRASCRRRARRCRRSPARGRARRSPRGSSSSGSRPSRCRRGRRRPRPSASSRTRSTVPAASRPRSETSTTRAQAELGELRGQAGDRAGAVVHARRALEEVRAVPGHVSAPRRGAGGGALDQRRRRGELDVARRRAGHLLEQRVDGGRAELVVVAAQRGLRRLRKSNTGSSSAAITDTSPRDLERARRGSRRARRRPG